MSAPAYPATEDGVIDLGHRHFVRPNGFGGYIWWHDCLAVDHVSWNWIGTSHSGAASGHVIVAREPILTVSGSLVCTDCGDHGFIRQNRWDPA